MVESYIVLNSNVYRIVQRRNGQKVYSRVPIVESLSSQFSNDEIFDKNWLLSKKKLVARTKSLLTLVDLFSGLGSMSLGVVEAGRALGIEIRPVLAVDNDIDSIQTYKLNFPSASCYNTDIETLITGTIGCSVTPEEKKLIRKIKNVDILIAGPPCQGNSDLNNHTRRQDPKNSLVLKVVRFAELFNPKHIIIENVQGIKHDKGNIISVVIKFLKSQGYLIHEDVLTASDFGVAQRRRRYFLVATKSTTFDFNIFQKIYSKSERNFKWACNDLFEIRDSSIFNNAAQHSIVNRKRIDYLFKKNLYELPDSQRPNCHRNGNHSYKSVYGRMYLDRPAPTITSGFGSIGQGRFCHPIKKRSITPHEAARLQFIPDYFKFIEGTKRGSYQRMIGNAVPSKLSYLIALELLR